MFTLSTPHLLHQSDLQRFQKREGRQGFSKWRPGKSENIKSAGKIVMSADANWRSLDGGQYNTHGNLMMARFHGPYDR